MITINGEPKGKQRPRYAQGHMYTPSETQEYEKIVHDLWIWQEKETYHGAVNVMITAYYGIPKSAPKSAVQMMLMGDRRPTKKPDADNIIKIICDGLNGAAYDDDKQVVEVSLTKYYSLKPRVEVEVVEI